MNNIALIQSYIKIFMEIFCIVFIVVKWQDIRTVFCEPGGGMSSKRVIALMGMATLCRLSIFVTTEKDGIDNNILAVLTVIVLTASAIATFPQVMELVGKIKNMAGKAMETPPPTPASAQMPQQQGGQPNAGQPQGSLPQNQNLAQVQ